VPYLNVSIKYIIRKRTHARIVKHAHINAHTQRVAHTLTQNSTFL